MSILIETNIGDIVVDLFVDKAPKTCINFIKLCKMKYYHFCTFFNVQKDYIAVTGDPTNTGSGGDTLDHLLDATKPKYMNDEVHPDLQKHSMKGIVATANPGPNLNDSQFYFTLTDKELPYLDNKHTIFGQVAEGLDVLDKLNKSYCDKAGKPYQAIYIKHTHVLDDPYPDPEGLVVPPASPTIPPAGLALDLAMDKEIKKKTEEEIKQETQAHEAKTRATVLWMLDDIPDADIKPPDNVLFVCKLNPVTQEEDLELIFAKYGQIRSCNIVRDKQSGDSLQYAFIEYETRQNCEEAYFHMQNALIDARRIHVDFSQSVAKEWVGYKRKQLADMAKKMVSDEIENKGGENYRIKQKERKDNRFGLVIDDLKLGRDKHEKQQQQPQQKPPQQQQPQAQQQDRQGHHHHSRKKSSSSNSSSSRERRRSNSREKHYHRKK